MRTEPPTGVDDDFEILDAVERFDVRRAQLVFHHSRHLQPSDEHDFRLFSRQCEPDTRAPIVGNS